MGQIEVPSGVVLVKPEVKRRLGRPRRRWKDDIKNGTPRKENGSVWIGLIYDIFINCNWVVTRWQYMAHDRDKWRATTGSSICGEFLALRRNS